MRSNAIVSTVRETMLVGMLVAGLVIAPRVMALTGFEVKDSGYTVTGAQLVELGGKVLNGVGGGAAMSVGTFALYYTGYEPDRNVLHLRSAWIIRGIGVDMGQGEQALTVPLKSGEPTRLAVALAPARVADNFPVVELEILGIDDLLRLQVSPSITIQTKK